MNKPLRISAALTLALSCGGTTPMPDPIRPVEDNCAHCRMQVSQPRFAAEILRPDGTYIKFDDIGCFRSYLKSDPSVINAPAWVMDFERSEWIEAKSAYYVMGAKEQTPMWSGILAFSDRERAARNDATVALYDDVIHGASN